MLRVVASLLHEMLVGLFRGEPRLLIELLRAHPCGLWLGHSIRFERGEPNFSRIPSIDADLVLVIYGPDGRRLCALVIEVQLEVDPRKYRSWPAYQAEAHRRYRCPCYLVVVAIDPRVAAWAAGPICTGQTTLVPIVIGPREVPVVDDLMRGRANVELTLLSGLAHHDRPEAVEIGEVLVRIIDEVGIEQGALYWDLFLTMVSEATRQTLKMRFENWKPQSDWGKGIYAEGMAAGEARGRREALYTLIEARGLPTRPEHRRRIDACIEPMSFLTWLRRAVTAASIDEVFDAPESMQEE